MFNTKKSIVPSSNNGLQLLDQVLTKAEKMLVNEKNKSEMDRLRFMLGDKLVKAYDDFRSYVHDYQTTIYYNGDDIESSTKMRLIFEERDNGFELEFDFVI